MNNINIYICMYIYIAKQDFSLEGPGEDFNYDSVVPVTARRQHCQGKGFCPQKRKGESTSHLFVLMADKNCENVLNNII